jgi:hypothetical protein
MAHPLNVTPRYLKALLKPMLRPTFMASTALVLGSIVLIVSALKQPEQFVGVNDPVAANDQANSELTPDNRAAGADIDDLSVLLKDLDNGGSAPALNLPTGDNPDGANIPQAKLAEGPKLSRSKGAVIPNEFLDGAGSGVGASSATAGQAAISATSLGRDSAFATLRDRNLLGSLLTVTPSQGTQAPEGISPLQAALNAQSSAKSNAMLLEETVQAAVKARTTTQLDRGVGVGSPALNTLPTLSSPPLAVPAAIVPAATGLGNPASISGNSSGNSSGYSPSNPSYSNTNGNLGTSPGSASSYAPVTPTYNPGYAAPVYNNSGYVPPSTGAAGASNYEGGTAAGVGTGTSTNAYGTVVNSGYVAPVNPVYNTPVYGAPPAPVTAPLPVGNR